MTKTSQIVVTVNGEKYVEDVPVRMNLADFLRTRLGLTGCLLYTSPSPRDVRSSRMPSSA